MSSTVTRTLGRSDQNTSVGFTQVFAESSFFNRIFLTFFTQQDYNCHLYGLLNCWEGQTGMSQPIRLSWVDKLYALFVLIWSNCLHLLIFIWLWKLDDSCVCQMTDNFVHIPNFSFLGFNPFYALGMCTLWLPLGFGGSFPLNCGGSFPLGLKHGWWRNEWFFYHLWNNFSLFYVFQNILPNPLC